MRFLRSPAISITFVETVLFTRLVGEYLLDDDQLELQIRKGIDNG